MGQNEGYGLGKHLVALQLCTSVTYLVCVCVCLRRVYVKMNGTPNHFPLLHHVAPNSLINHAKINK